MNNLDFRKEKNNHKILLSIYTDNFLTRTATENIIKHIQDTNFLSDKEKQKRIDYLRKDYEYKTNVNEIYFEGSKGAGKTKAIVRHILEDMVFDRRVSAFVIMDRLKESRDKTMREVEEELQAFNEEYDNVKSLFSFKRASDNLRIELKRPDGHKQEIYFENVENIAVAGQTPPLGTYFKYR
jgi:ABC-type Na+ transport system ATPase subunit NatA